MRNPPVAACLFSLVIVFSIPTLRADDSPAKAAKTRLVPRPLPGEPLRNQGVEERLVRKPYVEGAPGAVSGGTLQSDKARITLIRRAVVPGASEGGTTGGPAGFISDGRVNSEKAPARELPPLKPGQVRVLPKSEMKTEAVFEATAQLNP